MKAAVLAFVLLVAAYLVWFYFPHKGEARRFTRLHASVIAGIAFSLLVVLIASYYLPALRLLP